MLVFAVSDKGGTGRSVTSCNIVYRRALAGLDACYADFDFGSPTAGTIFQIAEAAHGVTEGGLHSYFGAGKQSDSTEGALRRIDVWRESSRHSLRRRPSGAGRLVLIPGDRDGAEFQSTPHALDRCVELFLDLEEEYDLTFVDLSAGRSYAVELVLRTTATPTLRNAAVRWLVFHRWTGQHIPAAADLAFGEEGILDTGVRCGHDESRLRAAIRFIRTAWVDPGSPSLRGLRPAQIAWLLDYDQDLLELAARRGVGRSATLGSVPLDPVLQWREQLLSDDDVYARDIANPQTIAAFDDLARKIIDPVLWECP